jgi:hypothetical protein
LTEAEKIGVGVRYAGHKASWVLKYEMM